MVLNNLFWFSLKSTEVSLLHLMTNCNNKPFKYQFIRFVDYILKTFTCFLYMSLTRLILTFYLAALLFFYSWSL